MKTTKTIESGGLIKLEKKISDLVRNHDRREPFVTNTIKRIMLEIKASGVKVEPISNTSNDYHRVYMNGYNAAKRRYTPKAPSEGEQS